MLHSSTVPDIDMTSLEALSKLAQQQYLNHDYGNASATLKAMTAQTGNKIHGFDHRLSAKLGRLLKYLKNTEERALCLGWIECQRQQQQEHRYLCLR